MIKLYRHNDPRVWALIEPRDLAWQFWSSEQARAWITSAGADWQRELAERITAWLHDERQHGSWIERTDLQLVVDAAWQEFPLLARPEVTQAEP